MVWWLYGQALGNAYRFAEAEQVGLKAFDIANKSLGLAHKDTLGVLFLLTGVYTAQGELEKAERAIRLRIEGASNLRPVDRHLVADAYLTLSVNLRRQMRANEALAAIDRALPLYRARFGERSSFTTMALKQKADVLIDLDRRTEATALRQQAFDLDMANPELTPIARAKAYSAWATALEDAGRFEEAYRYYSRALETEERVRRANDPELGDTLGDVARMEWKRGRPRQALKLYLRAQERYILQRQAKRKDLAELSAQIGELLMEIGRSADAVDFLKEAIRFDDEQLARGRGGNPRTKVLLGIAYIGLGRGAEAEAVLSAARREAQDRGGAVNRPIIYADASLMHLYLQEQRAAEAYRSARRVRAGMLDEFQNFEDDPAAYQQRLKRYAPIFKRSVAANWAASEGR